MVNAPFDVGHEAGVRLRDRRPQSRWLASAFLLEIHPAAQHLVVRVEGHLSFSLGRSMIFSSSQDGRSLAGRPFRAENGVVVALRRRGSMGLRGRRLAGRWSRVVDPSLLPLLMFGEHVD